MWCQIVTRVLQLWHQYFDDQTKFEIASSRSIDAKIAEPQLCDYSLLAAICRYAAEQQPWAPHISGILTNSVRCLLAGRARGGAEEGWKKSSIRRDIWWQQRFTIIQQTCPSLVIQPGLGAVKHRILIIHLSTIYCLLYSRCHAGGGMCNTGDSDGAPSSALPALDIDCGHFIDNI